MRKRFISAAFKLIKARFFNKKIPLIVGWSITDRCNWECIYCSSKERYSEEVTTAQAHVMIEELRRAGTYSINFTGGEPLLREDIGDLILCSKKKGLRVAVSSNGFFVPQRIDDLRNIDSLLLSYDGPQEVHDKQRQKGGYQHVVNAVDTAKKCNININLHTVLTKNNIDEVDSILSFAKFFDVSVNFTVIEFIPFCREENIKRLLPQRERYSSAFQRLILEKKKGNKHIGNTFFGLKYLSAWPQGRVSSCCAGRIYCRIEANGNLFPCASLILKNNPANFCQGGFQKAFRQLKQQDCDSCWCDTRIEMNNVYSLRLGSIFSIKNSYRL